MLDCETIQHPNFPCMWETKTVGNIYGPPTVLETRIEHPDYQVVLQTLWKQHWPWRSDVVLKFVVPPDELNGLPAEDMTILIRKPALELYSVTWDEPKDEVLRNRRREFVLQLVEHMVKNSDRFKVTPIGGVYEREGSAKVIFDHDSGAMPYTNFAGWTRLHVAAFLGKRGGACVS